MIELPRGVLKQTSELRKGVLVGVLGLTAVVCGLLGRPTPVSPVGRGWDLGQTVKFTSSPAWRKESRALNGWIRLSGLPGSIRSHADESTVQARTALREARAAGIRPLVKLRARGMNWTSGTRRLGNAAILPLDLREAYQWARSLGQTYGSLVAAWEVENEPELSYVPENGEHYAAYLKAVWHGLKSSGAGEPPGAGGREQGTAPLVLMAPLALPPGPFFASLVANGVLSYTDGFNFHYYGYAEDFTGVYRQHEAAITDLTRNVVDGEAPAAPTKMRTLPVFVSEYGYGALSGPAGATVDGRVRQWRWVRAVYEQIRSLRIEAPVIFQITPNHEVGINEFGLTMPRVASAPGSPGRLRSGGVSYRSTDFGAAHRESWMNGIGRNVGGLEATPALAWLLAQEPAVEPPRPFMAPVEAPTAVVIDFVAGEAMLPAKAYRGSFLLGSSADGRTGRGEIRLYNFGSAAVAGRLDLGDWATLATPSEDERLLLPSGGMVKLPVALRVPDHEFRPHSWVVRFHSDRNETSRFSTLLYPEASHLSRKILLDFFASTAGFSSNADVIDRRSLAIEEPPLMPSGRWRVSEGVTVEDNDGVWRFTVTRFPPGALRPATAELVLPDRTRMPSGSLLELEARLVPPNAASVQRVPEPRTDARQVAPDRERMNLNVRTANGNTYFVWHPLPFAGAWQRISQLADNITMGFYGRAGFPWRFAENEPVALVFQFRPLHLPAIFEIRRAHLVEYGK